MILIAMPTLPVGWRVVDGQLHAEVALRLAEHEQRYTRLRRALVESMAGADGPLTVPEILRSHPGLSQSTAYRNISTLVASGVARRVAGDHDHGRYELAEDLAGHHHHIVCARCGKVADVAPSPRLERALAEAARTTAGFEVTEHRFDLVGLCARCR
jgi:Fe2+ or Zn2+ uptake regulation protein